eukprot:4454899-Ditylum_brightwellii.AAC.2
MDGDVKSHMKSELLHLLAKSFPNLDPYVKDSMCSLFCKAFIASKDGPVSLKKRTEDDVTLCEHILAMDQADIHQDICNWSQFESHMLHSSVKTMLLHQKPPPSYLPLTRTRVLMGTRSHTRVSKLPPKEEKDSPSFLCDPPAPKQQHQQKMD